MSLSMSAMLQIKTVGVTGIHQDPSLKLSQYIWYLLGHFTSVEPTNHKYVFRLHLSSFGLVKVSFCSLVP